MSIREIAVSIAVGATTCLAGAVIAASPAQAPTLQDCTAQCPVVTPPPWRPLSHPDRAVPRVTLRP